MSRVAEYQTLAKDRYGKAEALFAEIDVKQQGQETPEQREQIKTWNKEAEEALASVKTAAAWDAERDTARKGLDYLGQLVRPIPFGSPESKGDAVALKGGYGEQFFADEGFQAWLKSISPNGRVAEKIKLSSPPVNMNGLGFKALSRPVHDTDAIKSYLKALVTGAGATSGGPFVNIDYTGIVDRGTFERPLGIRDLVTVLETNSDTVEYVRLGAHTNAAAAVAEATASSGSSGAKPESSLVTATVTETVKTIAHWIPATRRSLSDAPMLRGMIDSFLRYGLAEEVEDQIINGSGSGENLTGILNTSNTTAQAFDTDLLTTYRKAKTKVALTGRARATAYVLHPNDLEDLDLLTDNEARYYFGGPTAGGVPRLWGVPVVESEAMTEGTAMVADWRLLVLWDRMQTAIYVSDSHSDFFVRNLLAILAECRVASGCLRPSAFVEIALS